MVHRAPRTSRCLTCTRRKVKCDGERPACKRCQNGGWECAGYRSQVVFIDEGARFREDSSFQEAPEEPHQSSKSSPAVSAEQQALQKRLVWPPPGPKERQQIRQTPQRLSMRSVSFPEDAVFLTYFMSRLSCEALSSQSALLSVAPKAPLTKNSKPNSQIQSTAFQALATIFFGKHRRDRRVFDQGMRLYSKAMFNLRQALQDPSSAAEIDTLVGALCLCLLENIIFSEPLAWLRHYEGVGLLLKLQGPWQCTDETVVAITRYCRYLAILSAGHNRQHCFLANPEWQKPPSPGGPDQAPIDRLTDIFAHVPGILHDSDKLQRDGSSDESEEFRALQSRTQRVLDQLHEWPRYLSPSPPSSPDSFGPDPAPGSALPPQSPNDAVALAICNAVLLCLMSPCEQLSLSLFPEGGHDFTPNQTSLPMCEGSSNGKALAVEICHLATSALRGEQSLGIAFSFIFPLQIASYYLEPNSLESARLEGVMDCMLGETNGIEMGRKREWEDITPEQGADELTSKNFLRAL